MDEKQLNYEFMSILSESHPGLTFEEYRDSCIFLLFYQYLCLRYDDKLEDSYKLEAMVRLAIRGKLQMPSFLQFMEGASPFIHLACKKFQLTDLSFYHHLQGVQSLEKQKSYARFFRKFIKKIDGWDCKALLLEHYPQLFGNLLEEFARAKKETYISEELLGLYRMIFQQTNPAPKKVFVPDFQYGVLYRTISGEVDEPEIYGYETREDFIEILQIVCFMHNIPEESVHLYLKKDWDQQMIHSESFDSVAVFMPDGVEAGKLISSVDTNVARELLRSTAKGEFPFILSALPLLNESGAMAVVLPSALLYREGKEAQVRRYLVEEANCLDMIMLLPDHLFHSTGQKEVLLFFRKNRTEEYVMFFDCSEMESFRTEQLNSIETAWREQSTIPGFCSCVDRDSMKENDYNLNLPRYIKKSFKMAQIDLDARRKRIEEIDRELEEIEKRIAMYKRDLELI